MSGYRESQWLVMRRCWAIIRRLQRGPATREALLQTVFRQEGREAYGNRQDKALQRRFENDLQRIREKLLVNIAYDRKQKVYELTNTWLPLLDLPDEDLATLAWLEETFNLASPHHDEVHNLTDRLRFFLTVDRAVEMERRRYALQLNLARRDESEIPDEIWEALQRALEQGRRMEFFYTSPQQQDKQPRRHVVDFYAPPYFEEGHFYIRGYCQYTDGPVGKHMMRRYFNYRLDRISDVSLLPNKLPPSPPRPHTYEVRYELAPPLARKGVSRLRGLTRMQVEQRPDGAALVQGETEDLFRILQALMRYREHCRVLGGPELLQMMQETVEKMKKLYEISP